MTSKAIAGSGRKTETAGAEPVNFPTPPGIFDPQVGVGVSGFLFFGDSHEKNHSKQAREASSEGRAAAYATGQDWPDERTGPSNSPGTPVT